MGLFNKNKQNGKEIMYFQDEKVYECNFSGGIVK